MGARAQVQRERNDLLNDVESLCMSGDPGSIFDKSNLLGDRIQAASRCATAFYNLNLIVYDRCNMYGNTLLQEYGFRYRVNLPVCCVI